jgi:hypothetical protein
MQKGGCGKIHNAYFLALFSKCQAVGAKAAQQVRRDLNLKLVDN